MHFGLTANINNNDDNWNLTFNIIFIYYGKFLVNHCQISATIATIDKVLYIRGTPDAV